VRRIARPAPRAGALRAHARTRVRFESASVSLLPRRQWPPTLLLLHPLPLRWDVRRQCRPPSLFCGRRFHAACFKCAACGTALKGVPWKPHDATPYCAPCHAEQFGPTCAGCGEALTKYVKVGGQLWHKSCHEQANESKSPATKPLATKPPGKPKPPATKPPATKPPGKSKPPPTMSGARAGIGELLADFADM